MRGSTGGQNRCRQTLQLPGPRTGSVDDRACRREAEVGAHAEHAPRVALDGDRADRVDDDAAFAAGGDERAAEAAVVDVPFAAHEQRAGDVTAEPRLERERLRSVEQLAVDAARPQSLGAALPTPHVASPPKAAWTMPSRRSCGSTPLASRTRSTKAGYSRNDAAQSSSSASSRALSVYGASIPAPAHDAARAGSPRS